MAGKLCFFGQLCDEELDEPIIVQRKSVQPALSAGKLVPVKPGRENMM